MTDYANRQALIQQLLDSAESLRHRDGDSLDALLRRVEMVIRNLFGADSKYLTDLGRIAFSPSVYPTTEEYRNSSWASGSRNLKNLIRTMQEELTLFGNPSSKRTSVSKLEINKSIFVVHGHDEAMKVSVARTLERLGLAAVILHEKPNQGRTIIEKFGDYSDVGFAVVLLSPDDVGKLRAGPTERLGPRARQNVIFELGFFVGRLGRERVIALYRSADNFELPSDYSGILFVVFDESNRWQFDLVKELKAADYDVDANKLLDHE